MTSWLSKTTLQKLLDLAGLHCTTSERSGPSLTKHAAQLLVQALVISRLGYCDAFLAGLPSCTIKPFQMIQNAAARLVFSEPKRGPCYTSLYLPALAPVCSSHQVQETDACRTATDSAPACFHSLMTIYIPSRSLRSASERRLVVQSLRGTKSLSRTFSFTVSGWWNEIPPQSGMLNPWQFQAPPENSPLPSSLDFILKKKNFALFP